MNIRQKHMLNTLVNDGSIHIGTSAQKFNVGERTIRYDLDVIADYISTKLQHQGLMIKNNIAHLMINQDEIQDLRLEEMDNDYYEIKISSEERMIMILYDLCWATDKMTIQQFADKYFVSRGTINSDFIEIKKWCHKRDIPLVSLKGKGIYIDATEKQRRAYLSELIRSSTKLDHYKDFIFTEWFKDIDVETIKTIVTKAEKKYGIWLTDIAFEGLSIHIALSIKRYQSHHISESHEASHYTDIDPLPYQMASEIVHEINRQFELNLPETEIIYVAIHLGGKSSYLNEDDVGSHALVEYYAINMIIHVGNILKVDLKQDKRLLDGLIQHLRACRYRYKNDMVIENPLKEDLIESYPNLYQILSLFINDTQDQGYIRFNDDEMTYVLLHFAAAINRRSQKSKEIPNILVVCSTGLGTSELVVSSLNRYFKLKIQACTALHQLQYYLGKYPIDLIITTVPLESIVPHVRVHPILTDEDNNNIRKKLSELGFEIINQEDSITKELSILMDHYMKDKDDSKLINELTELYQKIKPNENSLERTMGEYKMLSELLTDQTIQLNVDVLDWQEAIRASGKILVEQEYITDDYIQASIHSVKEYGPYIVITKGVALAHATNNQGVLRTGMSLVRLKTPVEFGNANNDPVRFVFTLATIDSTSHLVALSDLAEFLERKEFMNILSRATEAEQLIKYIKENETNVKGE